MDLENARKQLRDAEAAAETARRSRASWKVQEELGVDVDEAAAEVRKQTAKWEWS